MLEMCEFGSMAGFIRTKQGEGKDARLTPTPLSTPEAAAVLHEVVCGLCYLHDERRIIHRDIKSANILVGRDPHGDTFVRIGDFGISRHLSAAHGGPGGVAHTTIGTPHFLAPEVIKGATDDTGYGFPADVWSLGVTAIELTKGFPRYHDLPAMIVAPKILQTPLPPRSAELPSNSDDDAQRPPFDDFLADCMQHAPGARARCSDLLNTRLLVPYSGDVTTEAGARRMAVLNELAHRVVGKVADVDICDTTILLTASDPGEKNAQEQHRKLETTHGVASSASLPATILVTTSTTSTETTGSAAGAPPTASGGAASGLQLPATIERKMMNQTWYRDAKAGEGHVPTWGTGKEGVEPSEWDTTLPAGQPP